MILTGYNIQLSRLTFNDIEMVRQWRNSKTVSNYMEYRGIISFEQQKEWFQSINNEFNNYFLIIEQGEPVGLIYGAQINWAEGITGNGGIFMCDEKYFLTDIPLRAMFLINDVGCMLGLQKTFIKVLSSNERAKFFNKQLGYEILPDQEGVINQRYVLTNENYLNKSIKFKKAMGFDSNVEIKMEFKSPLNTAEKNMLQQLELNQTFKVPGVILKIINAQ